MNDANKKKQFSFKNVSLKWKIFLFLLGFSFLLLIILWVFQTVLLERFYTSIKLSQVEKEAKSIARLVETGDLDGISERVRVRGDLWVELVQEDGQSMTILGGIPSEGLFLLTEEQRINLYARALENGGSFSMRYDNEDDPQFMQPFESYKGQEQAGPRPWRDRNESVIYATLVDTPGDVTVLLLVRAGITPLNATVETLRVQLVVISGIMLVLAVGIALLMASRVARPIEKLNESAQQLGRGNYDVSFEAEGYREIQELSTTLSRAAVELSKTEDLRRDLIANVSHDLRTPLTLITGYAEMMRDIPGENNPENMQVIIDEANRLTSLVSDLLDLSRLQSGTVELHLEPMDLTNETADIISRFSKFSEPEGFDVNFQYEHPVRVQADPVRITQVIYNFLINAMTHGGAEKKIMVRQYVNKGRVRMEVTDTGEGIAEKDMPYIWERYYKVDKDHKRTFTGAGLGLSIVKGILEQHPGIEYGVESQLGQGSTFWFSLPVLEDDTL